MLSSKCVHRLLRSRDISTLKLWINSTNINRNFEGHTILHYVCHIDFNLEDTPELVKWLITERGANVNLASHWGYTPLHYAVVAYPKSVKVLLECGANVNKTATDEFRTPLDCFLHHYRHRGGGVNWDNIYSTGWLLLEYGARVNKEKPGWLATMMRSREFARKAAQTILGLRRFRKSTLIEINGMDTTRIIAGLIWESRRNFFE